MTDEARKALADELQLCADDPMWASHAEVSKRLLAKAATALRSREEAARPSVNEYVVNYEYRGDQDYAPSEGERDMIEDAIEGYLNTLPTQSSVMQLAGNAAKVISGWSNAKRDYSERATSSLTPSHEAGTQEPVADEQLFRRKITKDRIWYEAVAAPQPASVAQAKPDCGAWMTMESAPKDGTRIQGWHILWKCPVSVRYMRAALSWVECTLTTRWPDEAFSHWMPEAGPPVPSTSRATLVCAVAPANQTK